VTGSIENAYLEVAATVVPIDLLGRKGRRDRLSPGAQKATKSGGEGECSPFPSGGAAGKASNDR